MKTLESMIALGWQVSDKNSSINLYTLANDHQVCLLYTDTNTVYFFNK